MLRELQRWEGGKEGEKPWSRWGPDLVPCGVIHSCSRCVPGAVPGPACGSEETVWASVPWEPAVQRSWEKGRVERELEVLAGSRASARAAGQQVASLGQWSPGGKWDEAGSWLW